MRQRLRTIAAAALLAGATVPAAATATTVAGQAAFVFDRLGPIACELPPTGFDLSGFRRMVKGDPDAPLARGQIGGALEAEFAGGGLYGADPGGGYVVSIQGMLLDDGPQLTMLCLVLVRLGPSGGPGPAAGPIVGEDGLDAAADGAFLGVFKLVRRDAAGRPETFAEGRVTGGRAAFERVEGDIIAGSVSVEGEMASAGTPAARPFTARIQVPRAERVIRPALRLQRN